MYKETANTVTLFHKPLSLVRVTTPRVSSCDASRWTTRRRSSKLSAVRDVISGGGGSVQLQDELAVLTKEEREELLVSAASPTQITPEETLAMKADLALPWRKLRIMRR